MKPKYIQALGGLLVFAGSLMPWVIWLSFTVPSRELSASGIQHIAGFPMLLGGPLIALVAIVSSKAPGAPGSRFAAGLGFLALLYMGNEVITLAQVKIGIGVWVCLLGGFLAFAGGWLRNPGATPHLSTSSSQMKTADVLHEGSVIQQPSMPSTQTNTFDALPNADDTPQPPTPSSQAKLKVPVLGILFLTTLLGCLVPYLVIQYQQNLYQKVYSPPEKANEILLENRGQLYIRTAEGKVFLCSFSAEQYSCIEISSEQVPTVSDSQSRCSNPPSAPGKVIASYDICLPMPDGSSSARWVILEDGSVWRWHLTCAMFGCAANAIPSAVSGAILGLVAGMIIALIINWRSARRRSQPSTAKTSSTIHD